MSCSNGAWLKRSFDSVRFKVALLGQDLACRKAMKLLGKQQIAVMMLQKPGKSPNLEARASKSTKLSRQALLAEGGDFLEQCPDTFAEAERFKAAHQGLWQTLSALLQASP